MRASGNYIPSLNGLRALSISIVIFSHLYNIGDLGKFEEPFPFYILLDGSFGVNVFFTISGYLITYLLLAEEKRNGSISLKNFYLRRFFRIFPAYYFVLFVYLILQLCSVLYFSRMSWFSSIFYFKYLAPKEDPESFHFWSLSMEEHFYLVWPVVFLFFKKARKYFAFFIILLVFLCRFLAYYQISSNPLFADWGFIFQRVDAIMIGCLCAIYNDKIKQFLVKHTNRKFLLLIAVLLFINTRYFLLLNREYKLHLGFLLVPLYIGLPIGFITNLFIALAMMYSIYFKNKWFEFLNLPFMNFIGKLSYSLYLWQQLFTLSKKLGPLNHFPLNILCTITAALISYYCIEKPFLKIKARFE